MVHRYRLYNKLAVSDGHKKTDSLVFGKLVTGLNGANKRAVLRANR